MERIAVIGLGLIILFIGPIVFNQTIIVVSQPDKAFIVLAHSYNIGK
jgi:hypothetical protein